MDIWVKYIDIHRHDRNTFMGPRSEPCINHGKLYGYIFIGCFLNLSLSKCPTNIYIYIYIFVNRQIISLVESNTCGYICVIVHC